MTDDELFEQWIASGSDCTYAEWLKSGIVIHDPDSVTITWNDGHVAGYGAFCYTLEELTGCLIMQEAGPSDELVMYASPKDG